MMTIILNFFFLILLLFQTYGRLEKQGVCLSHTSMINLLDLMGGHFHDKIVELVKAGKKFYTVNDNFNCKTTVKNMRVDHRNKQHNWFASIVVFERIDFSHLDNVRSLGDIQNFSNENYLLTSEEIKKLQSDFKVLVGRIFLGFFKQPQFAAVKKLVPQHILHRYTNEMSSKSEVFPLAIQFKDEKKKICRCGRHLPHLKQYLKQLQIMKVLNKKRTSQLTLTVHLLAIS